MPPRTWLFFGGTLCARDVPVGVPKLIVHTLFIRPGRTLSRCAHGMTQAQFSLIPELVEQGSDRPKLPLRFVPHISFLPRRCLDSSSFHSCP